MAAFECTICVSEFVEPVTAPCGHTLCRDCYVAWVACPAAPACPTCRAPLPREPPAVNVALRDALAAAAQRRLPPALAAIPEADLAFDASAAGLLGRGSFGEVRRAAWRGTPVAVKCLQLDALDVGEGPARDFEREVQVLARLRHPNVVHVLGMSRLGDGRLALAQELAEGGSLYGRLHPARGAGGGVCSGAGAAPAPVRLCVAETARIGLDIARALAAAHGAGVAHNDVKSMNVLFDAAGKALLADFGSAKHARTALPNTFAAILGTLGGGQGGLLGSPNWTAPENLNEEGAQYGQPPADVYSFGMLLYEMACGAVPWGGRSIMAIADAVRAGRRPEVPAGVHVDGRVWVLVERCWAQVPADRPTASALVGELAALLRGSADFVMPMNEHGGLNFGPVIVGSLAAWRAANPSALVASVEGREDLTDADFVHLRGLRGLDMSRCSQATITDAAFAHLRGIHTLDMSYQKGITDAAFVHLRGIHTLIMHKCRHITDAAFVHLRGIHTLNMSWCNQESITDAAFEHLRGIHTLDMSFCCQESITGASFVHLRGIHTLNMSCTLVAGAVFEHLAGIQRLFVAGCNNLCITDAALAHLRGIHTLDIGYCFNDDAPIDVTDAGWAHLRGIHELSMYHCMYECIAAARAQGLPVTNGEPYPGY